MHENALDPATPPERHRFHFLDALRGLAAILVIIRHAPPVYRKAFVSPNSFLAVDFFFCLSGFVIAFSYEKRLQGLLTFKNFFLARVIRLYPIAAIGTLIGAADTAFFSRMYGHSPVSVLNLAKYIALGLLVLPSYRDVLFPLDFVMWTLFFELVANIFYAALVRFGLARLPVIAAIAGLSLALIAFERTKLGTVDQGWDVTHAYMGMTRVCLSFFAGVLTFRMYKRFSHEGLREGHSVFAGVGVVGAFVLVLCGPAFFTRNAVSQLLVLAVVFPLIVYFGAHIALSPRWTTICAFLGTISYPLYILHPVLLRPLQIPGSRNYAASHTGGAKIIMLIAGVVLVIVSWFVAKYYDTPMRQMLTSYVRSRATTSKLRVSS